MNPQKISLNSLIKLAESATKGEWFTFKGDDSYEGNVCFGDKSNPRRTYYLRDSDKFREDDDFIAAANPQTVRTLCEALQKAMDALEQHSDADILNPGVRPNTAGRTLQELREVIGD
jgi:hypothetical protein